MYDLILEGGRSMVEIKAQGQCQGLKASNCQVASFDEGSPTATERKDDSESVEGPPVDLIQKGILHHI